MKYINVLSLLIFATPVLAQPVPKVHVPTSVLLELRMLERNFDTALAADCSLDRCTSKGCTYVQHQSVDLPKSASLPGLPSDKGPGSVPPQDYLTEARCEFTHERFVSKRNVGRLVKRLEERLARGWLKVKVVPQMLPPIPRELAEPIEPVEKEEPAKEEAQEPVPEPVVEEPKEPEWTGQQALRELWEALLPHYWWMVAIFLATIALAVLIWAYRRLGAPSIEEKVMEAQLANTGVETETPAAESVQDSEAERRDAERQREREEEESFSEQQQKIWMKRLGAQSASNDELVVELLRDWLQSGDFPMLARALMTFGDQLSASFSSDGSQALRKLEFADYFRQVDEEKLPSKAEFFRRLNQSAMASLLSSQSDVRLFRSLREDFGSSGVVNLMQELPTRYAALLFALVPRDTQHDVGRLMPKELRVKVADQLFASSRISKSESTYIFSCITAALEGETLPKPPNNLVTDRGPALDAASALSILLPLMEPETRNPLFQNVLQSASGAAPVWFEDILFPEMLDRIPDEDRMDLLLEVDVRALAAWLSLQDADWRRGFLKQMSATMQKAVQVNANFESRAEQMRLFHQGHREITKALKGQYAKGKTSFIALAA